ncbi:MAG: nucleotidyl transferase AbiEii/AbiGii toxin family protein [Caldisericia bacterium]|nr:nucleotidyl transferase AbiEii/AbiGii toxin family protein [Caldisericia bacterium]
MLISAIVGLETRTTMDMDVTVRDLKLDNSSSSKIFEEICNIKILDNVSFVLKNIEYMREDKNNPGMRVALEANFMTISVPVKIDITSCDKIVPSELVYNYKLLFESRNIEIFTYSLETILSEKLETIISRGDQNTRSRDFYDVFILYKLQKLNINNDMLCLALIKTATQRGSLLLVEQYKQILNSIQTNQYMNKRWIDYQRNYKYAESILFSDICLLIVKILDGLDIESGLDLI